LNSFADPLIWQEKVESMKQLGGQTFTRNAMQYTLDNMWTFSEPERTRLLVLITDGQPTGDEQSPCDLYPTFLDQHIQILVVGVGQDVQNYSQNLVCYDHPDIKLLLLEDFVQSYEQVVEIYNFICPPGSPFDAGYSSTGNYENGYPTYKSNRNFISYWQDHRWWFRTPDNSDRMYLLNTTLSQATTPPDRQSWSWVNETLTQFDNVRIICSDTAIPTFYPTTFPSGSPSVYPTEHPTALPSGQPSVQPTNAPTDCCSAIPDLLEALEECYASQNISNPLVDMLQELLACDGVLENCMLSNSTGHGGDGGDSGDNSLSSMCCAWAEQLRELLEWCRNGGLANWGNGEGNCPAAEDYENLRGCYNNIADDVSSLTDQVTQCNEDVNMIKPIYDILDVDVHVEYWFTAVSDGSLDCAFVPPNICTRISTVCKLNDRGTMCMSI